MFDIQMLGYMKFMIKIKILEENFILIFTQGKIKEVAHGWMNAHKEDLIQMVPSNHQ